MTPASGHYPIETMRERLRDHSRRLMALERAPTHPYHLPAISVVAMPTFTGNPDPDGAVFAIDTDNFHFQGATHTRAEWQAMHP